MKFRKLSLSLLFLAPFALSAQVMEKYEGVQLNRMSNNGRFIVDGVSGVKIIDRNTNARYSYGSGFMLGMGNSISDDGIIVGTRNENSQPCYWKDGEWYDLPHNVPNVVEGIATGITADGKVICGLMGCSGLTKVSWPMNQPVLWTLNESSGEYEFEILPIPEEDITTVCRPQQIQARFISDDGDRILAQIVDYRGLLQYQLLYTKSAEGEWTYEVCGDNLLIKPNSVWPEYPVRPTMPRPENYLTPEEVDAFNKANRAYKDSLEIVSLTGKNPKAPFYQDFVKERKEEYERDVAKYQEDSDSYITRLYAFFDAYAANVTNNNFNSGSQRLSGNGKYYAANFVYSGPADPITGKAPSYVSPIRYDVESKIHYHTPHSSMASFSIGNNGEIMAVTPRTDDKVLTREPYLIFPDDPQALVPFADWVKSECPVAYDWIQENMKYDVDEMDAKNGVAVTDSVFYGSIRMDPTFRRMISYVVNPSTNVYDSYFIDLDAQPESALNTISEDTSLNAYPNPTGDVLYFSNNVITADIYSLSGQLVLRKKENEKSVSLRSVGIPSGIYLVRMNSDKGTRTEKVILK